MVVDGIFRDVLASDDAVGKHLTKVFGLKDLPRPEVKAHRDVNAAVERVTQQAIAAGVKMPIEELRKEVEKRLKPALLTA